MRAAKKQRLAKCFVVGARSMLEIVCDASHVNAVDMAWPFGAQSELCEPLFSPVAETRRTEHGPKSKRVGLTCTYENIPVVGEWRDGVEEGRLALSGF